MLRLRKSSQIAVVPDEGMFQLVFNLANSVFASLGNHVQGGPTVSGGLAAPYRPITSPVITRQASGVFLIFASVTISVTDSGNIVDADSVTFNLTRVTPGPVQLTPNWVTAASTATGAAGSRGVAAQLTGGFIDPSGIAQGATASYGLTVSSVNAAHTSGVFGAADGNIYVIELPG